MVYRKDLPGENEICKQLNGKDDFERLKSKAQDLDQLYYKPDDLKTIR